MPKTSTFAIPAWFSSDVWVSLIRQVPNFRLPLYLIAFAHYSLAAQTDHTQQIASGISNYRAFLLEDKIVERQLLGIVLKKLERLNIPEEDRSRLASRAARYTNGAGDWDFVMCRRSARASEMTYVDSLSDEELSVLAINADLYDIVNIGVLELDYPFKVKSDFNLHKELFFYNIRKGERIGEIGAGNGEFSVLLAMIYDSLNLSVNELNPHFVKYIESKFQRLSSVTRAESVEIVFGEEYNANFDSDVFDKIIIRNAFHHFYDRNGMMASIRKSLSDDGFLFLLERTIALSRKAPCPFALSESQIIRYVEKAGFELVDLMEVDRAMLFKFRKGVEEKKRKRK